MQRGQEQGNCAKQAYTENTYQNAATVHAILQNGSWQHVPVGDVNRILPRNCGKVRPDVAWSACALKRRSMTGPQFDWLQTDRESLCDALMAQVWLPQPFANAENRPLQGQEKKQLRLVLRKLDKEALNMYTPLRIGLGTRGLSWIRLDFRKMEANENGQRIQEDGQQ